MVSAASQPAYHGMHTQRPSISMPFPGCHPASRDRHYLFEGRPLQLFLLHAGYHALVLTGCCCLLAVFGQPLASGGSSSEGSGGRARCSAAHLNRAEL